MLTIMIHSGLGNQMFQYAYIKALSLRNQTNFNMDIGFFKTYFRKYELANFNIQKQYIPIKHIPIYTNYLADNRYINYILFLIKEFIKKVNKNYHIEKTHSFNSTFMHIKKGYIQGYFQSERYFKDYEKNIREDFEFKKGLLGKNKEIAEIIDNCNSISIHIRRGDYVTNKKDNKRMGVQPINYYEEAIAYIQKKIKNPTFFIFSDDILWVKENLILNQRKYFVNRNTGDNSYIDMQLMSLCKHNVIANSTFSRWGAWLNKNKEKIVVAPKKRFNDEKRQSDIIPTNWIKI